MGMIIHCFCCRKEKESGVVVMQWPTLANHHTGRNMLSTASGYDRVPLILEDLPSLELGGSWTNAELEHSLCPCNQLFPSLSPFLLDAKTFEEYVR
jgi:hypothetical protein